MSESENVLVNVNGRLVIKYKARESALQPKPVERHRLTSLVGLEGTLDYISNLSASLGVFFFSVVVVVF